MNTQPIQIDDTVIQPNKYMIIENATERQYDNIFSLNGYGFMVEKLDDKENPVSKDNIFIQEDTPTKVVEEVKEEVETPAVEEVTPAEVTPVEETTEEITNEVKEEEVTTKKRTTRKRSSKTTDEPKEEDSSEE